MLLKQLCHDSTVLFAPLKECHSILHVVDAMPVEDEGVVVMGGLVGLSQDRG